MAENELKELVGQRDTLLERAKSIIQEAAALTAKIEEKCAKAFEEIRAKTGQEYGTVTAVIEGYQVKQVVGKTVTWNQGQLEAIAGRIAAAGDSPRDWMTSTWGVKEKAFGNWAPEIQAVFRPARTVKPKSPTYEFKEVQANAS